MFLWTKISSLGSFVTQCAHGPLGQKGACTIQCQIPFNSLAVSKCTIEHFRLIIVCHRNLWTLYINEETLKLYNQCSWNKQILAITYYCTLFPAADRLCMFFAY